VHAGFKNPAAPAIYYGIRLSLALGLPILAGLLPMVWGLETIHQMLLLTGLTAFGYVAPSIYLDHRVSARKATITRALPDALDLMVVCVEAGLGINQSLARVAEEFLVKSPALSAEFSLVGHETRAGKSTTEALRSLANRTGVADVSSLVALLVQTERFGTSVANALRVHADAMRIRRMQRAEERAQKATLKLILPSTMIFAALLMIFLTPGMHGFLSAFSDIK
jgi:tight adherence protein C